MPNRTDLRQQLRRTLKDYPSVDTLNGALTADATSVEVARGNFAGAPQVVEIDKELIYAPAFSGASWTGCVRGHLGTTATTHADSAQVRFGFRFSSLDLDEAINSAIRRMSSMGLYQMKTIDRTYTAAVAGYDLASDAIAVYEVRAATPGPALNWPRIRNFDVAPHMPTDDFASGVALILHQGAYPGQTVRVAYQARYSLFSNDTADITTLGIQDFAQDVVVVGAAAELLATEEVPRTQLNAGEETQRGVNSPPRHAMSVYGQLEQRFQQRAAEVQRELSTRYPKHIRIQ